MLDIKFICENPQLVKDNIVKKFKENKLPKIIAAVAAGLILFFVAGSIIRAVVNGIEDKRNEESTL